METEYCISRITGVFINSLSRCDATSELALAYQLARSSEYIWDKFFFFNALCNSSGNLDLDIKQLPGCICNGTRL